MGGVHDRRPRPTIPFDSQMLARVAEQEAGDDDDASVVDPIEFAIAGQPASHPHVIAQPPAAPRLGMGTTPPEGMPRIVVEPEPEVELRSRTATVHDPLTTSLLAEIARRAQTMSAEDDEAADEEPRPAGPPKRR